MGVQIDCLNGDSMLAMKAECVNGVRCESASVRVEWDEIIGLQCWYVGGILLSRACGDGIYRWSDRS